MADCITVLVASADAKVVSAVSKTLAAPRYVIRMRSDFVFLPHLPSNRVPKHGHLFSWHQIIAAARQTIDFVAATCLSGACKPDIVIAAEMGVVEIASNGIVHCNSAVVWATLLDVSSGTRYHGHSAGVPVPWNEVNASVSTENVLSNYIVDSEQLVCQAVSVCVDQWVAECSPAPVNCLDSNNVLAVTPHVNSAPIMNLAKDCLSAILFYVDEEYIARLEMCNRTFGSVVSSVTRRRRETGRLLFPSSLWQKRIPDGVLCFAMRCASNLTLPQYTPSYKPLLLPSTIHTFRFDGQFDNAFVPHLPKSLTHLSMPNDVRLTDDGVRQLPESIVHLDLRCNSTITGDVVRHLNPHLQHLQLTRCFKFKDGAIASLPKELVYLDLYSATLYPRSIDDLPKHLTYLVCRFEPNSFHDEHMTRLPRTLAHLFLTTPLVSDAGMAQLPPLLKHLSMSSNKQITDACIPTLPKSLRSICLPHVSGLTASCFKHLPPNLSDLTITVSGDVDPHIQQLPQALQALYLKALDNCISDAYTSHLPQSLTSLTLTSNTILTDAAVKHLPRGLTRLSMLENDLWTDAAVPDLPPLLVSLELNSNRSFTPTCITNLPRGLTFLGLRTNPNIDKRYVARLLSHVETVIISRQSYRFGEPYRY